MLGLGSHGTCVPLVQERGLVLALRASSNPPTPPFRSFGTCAGFFPSWNAHPLASRTFPPPALTVRLWSLPVCLSAWPQVIFPTGTAGPLPLLQSCLSGTLVLLRPRECAAPWSSCRDGLCEHPDTPCTQTWGQLGARHPPLCLACPQLPSSPRWQW